MVGAIKLIYDQYYMSTLEIPTLNTARQRRAYQTTAFAWYEQVLTLSRWTPLDARFGEILSLLLAMRLDCLLGANLLGWLLDLTPASRDWTAWWWLKEVAAARCSLPLLDSFESAWAGMWLAISSAMLQVRAIMLRD